MASFDPTIPRALEAICQKAMAHAKADRYPSAAALAEDVQRYLAGESVMAYPEGWRERMWRWARKHRGAAWGNRAAAVLRLGARLRLAARALLRPFLSPLRRAAWSADDDAVRRALAAIRPCHPSP